MPKISVLMPVYNIKEEWLKKSIESILNQTYADFEFIIVDDGSTNNTPQILKKYQQKDNRIKIIQGEHKGISNALNKGLKEAKGEYIARMDGDDIAFAERFEKQIEYMENHKDIGILGTAMKGFPKKIIFRYKKEICLFDMLTGCPIGHPSVLMRHDLIKKYNLYYSENHTTSEDFELWSRAIEYVKIVNLKEVLLNYRLNPNGNSRNKKNKIYDYEIKQKIINKITTDKKIQKEIWKIVDKISNKNTKFLRKIFSIGNAWKRGKKYKAVKIFGFDICYKEHK